MSDFQIFNTVKVEASSPEEQKPTLDSVNNMIKTESDCPEQKSCIKNTRPGVKVPTVKCCICYTTYINSFECPLCFHEPCNEDCVIWTDRLVVAGTSTQPGMEGETIWRSTIPDRSMDPTVILVAGTNEETGMTLWREVKAVTYMPVIAGVSDDGQTVFWRMKGQKPGD